MDARQKILKLIGEKRISRAAVAKAAGVAYNTFRSYLDPKNPSTPASGIGVKIANFLEVPAGWLWDKELDWPPHSDSIINIPDGPLVAEVSRRRQMVRADMWSIVHRLQSDDVIFRTARIAEKTRENTSDRELKVLMAVFHDLRQLDALRVRLDWIDPDVSVRSEDEPPSAQDLIQNFAVLRRMLEQTIAENAPFKPLDRLDRAVPTQPVIPFSGGFGETVTRAEYAGMSVFQQRGYVPMLDYPTDAPPQEKPLMIEQGQEVPAQFSTFVRYDGGGPRSFAYRVDAHNMEPEIAVSTIIICDPDYKPQDSEAPKLFILEGGREHGIYRLKGMTLHSNNAQEFKPRRLKRGERTVSYPILASFWRQNQEGEKTHPRAGP